MSRPVTEDGPSVGLGESEPVLPSGTEDCPSLDVAVGGSHIKPKTVSPSGAEERPASSGYKSVESPNPVSVLTVHGRPSSSLDVDNNHFVPRKPYSLASCHLTSPPPSTSKAVSTSASVCGTLDYGVDGYNSESTDGSFVSRANMPDPESGLDSASESQSLPLGANPCHRAAQMRSQREQKRAENNLRAARRYREKESRERRDINKELAALSETNASLRSEVEHIEQVILHHRRLLQEFFGNKPAK